MKNLIPQVRFPEFAGEWEEIKLGELTAKIGDGLHGTPVYSEDSDIYFINGNNLTNGKIEVTEKTKKVDYKIFAKNNKSLNENSILISLNGTIGSISKYNNEKVMLGKSVGYFNFKESTDFYFHTFHTDKIQNFFITELTGSTIKNLSLKTLRETIFLLPSLPEQTKIANFLTAVDEKLTALNQKKTLLEQYKKGVMQQIFAQELRFKDDNGNDFADWEEKKLGEVCINISYGMNAAATTYDGKNKYLRITDIEESSNGLNMDKATSPNGKLEDKFRVKIGDLLFARTGASVGKSYLYREEDGILYFAGFLIRFHVKHAIPSFIYLYMQTYNYDKWIKVMSMRSGQPGINAEEYKLFEIPFPSLPEQTKIANFLSAIDEKINHCQEQIDQSTIWKKGLLQQMFV
ncbi:hypothetical protein FFWV33_15680 [Flavobacterium faecale]|uniref:Type I restriction modification DNA specificity domain-containing protein n=1 Tax=Flavobacterium faecale TaxID=1355330 RepID=A0A2S1LGI2_9FLAO|nr:restriction endonuclease subunit S [Flavobacterium faecale]AWG22864.1 hypothetical protein FFWV33_15680 [Flavobacterium faecale]